VDQGPLVTEHIEEGAKLVSRIAAECFPVQAAFWLKDYDDGEWILYIASDTITDGNKRPAYRAVNQILGPKPSMWLENVRVTGTAKPLVQDILEIQQKHPSILPRRMPSIRLGDRSYQDSYIYAPVTAASPS
jgi:hypothetical protein